MDKLSGDTERTMESEVPSQLPTSGQILGVLARSMAFNDPRLRSKNAQRYFSGRMENLVKESSRSEIIQAISDALVELGFRTIPQTGDETSSTSALASILDRHAVQWDRLRTFLLPRMSRVYPSHLAAVWQTYLRLVAIELALRVAALLHLAGASRAALDFLDSTSASRRGAYLNKKRSEAGLSLMRFAELTGVTDNTAEAWVYRGTRPTDEHIVEIGRALTTDGDTDELNRVVRELRSLHWVSDIAQILEKHIGAQAVAGIVDRLHRYVTRAYEAIDYETIGEAGLADLATLGSRSSHAEPLLTSLTADESDEEWKDDLAAVGSDWVRRVLSVNFQVHRSEVDALIQETDGRILKDWDVRNPRAYEHYQRSIALQMQGKVGEALAEVAKAIELDPLDPANHFTMGSVKSHIGVRNGDEALVKEGLEACWIAVTLDPNWIVPWTEIGWILVENGRARAAVEHLRAVSPECRPLDSRYYAALGVALRESGDFTGSLAAFESSLKLNPDETPVAVAAASAALLADDKIRSNRHKKVARHLGASDELNRHLELM